MVENAPCPRQYNVFDILTVSPGLFFISNINEERSTPGIEVAMFILAPPFMLLQFYGRGLAVQTTPITLEMADYYSGGYGRSKTQVSSYSRCCVCESSGVCF